jgi:hypothetical protein
LWDGLEEHHLLVRFLACETLGANPSCVVGGCS